MNIEKAKKRLGISQNGLVLSRSPNQSANLLPTYQQVVVKILITPDKSGLLKYQNPKHKLFTLLNNASH